MALIGISKENPNYLLDLANSNVNYFVLLGTRYILAFVSKLFQVSSMLLRSELVTLKTNLTRDPPPVPGRMLNTHSDLNF